MLRAHGGEALVTLATDLISLGLFHRRLIMWKTRSDWNTQRMTLGILKVRSHVGWHRGSVERLFTQTSMF